MDSSQLKKVKKRYDDWGTSFDTGGGPSQVLGLRPPAMKVLDLKPGETVLDFGCGTGMSFEYLEQGIGPEGRIIGVELSPEMLVGARDKIEANGWRNITLIEGNAEEVEIPEQVDAVLAFFVPELMASRPAMERAVGGLKPGGRIVATGIKRSEGLTGFFVNLYYLLRFRVWKWAGVKVAFRRLWTGTQPYELLGSIIGPLDRTDLLGGWVYVARGEKRASSSFGKGLS